MLRRSLFASWMRNLTVWQLLGLAGLPAKDDKGR